MKLESSIIGLFASFARGGTTIDAVAVSAAAYPDTDPADNWEDFGCVSEGRNEPNVAQYPVMCPKPSGGYEEKIEEQVLRDSYVLNFNKTNPYYWELAEGFNAAIVNGTAQTPGQKGDRFIEGWLKLQKRGSDGQDRIVKNVWGKLRLNEQFSASSDPTRPVFRFDVEYSAIATSEPNDIQTA
jgi:hypothetical protein